MAQIILDMGSGNSCKNSADYAKLMIDAVAAIDSHRHEVIFKFQLFQDEPPNIPLDHLVFNAAYYHAKSLGYKTTSSVFDALSLEYLLRYEIPFVKIACRPRLYWLIGEIPRRVPVYVSYWESRHIPFGGYITPMFCVPKYPAALSDYDDLKYEDVPIVSDHTKGLELWNAYAPHVWEKHFILEDDPTNPDAAGHAIKPDLVKEIIGA
jgi:hypothetical protein